MFYKYYQGLRKQRNGKFNFLYSAKCKTSVDIQWRSFSTLKVEFTG